MYFVVREIGIIVMLLKLDIHVSLTLVLQYLKSLCWWCSRPVLQIGQIIAAGTLVINLLIDIFCSIYSHYIIDFELFLITYSSGSTHLRGCIKIINIARAMVEAKDQDSQDG